MNKDTLNEQQTDITKIPAEQADNSQKPDSSVTSQQVEPTPDSTDIEHVQDISQNDETEVVEYQDTENSDNVSQDDVSDEPENIEIQDADNSDDISQTDENETEPSSNSETTQEDKPVVINPYHERYYLLYGNHEKCKLDLKGTSDLLKALGYDGGELKKARMGKAISHTLNQDENSPQMICSYCGLEVSGIEYYRLPDDRIRCMSCSQTLVKSEMQKLCDRVILNMESFFGISINVPIQIEVLEEKALKRKIKCSIGAIDNNSLLVLGAAVNNKKEGYRIYLENGAPRISVIATFAHELTHIWQYINWDNKKGFPSCPKNKRLLIYEGMAKWAEIQYLYLIGETEVAQREEFVTRKREDEYGIGFRLYERQYPLSYETVICNDSPFVKTNYPINI